MSENHQMPDQSPKSNRESVQAQSSWKKWLSRKWVFPAIYLCAAAIILSLMWVYQDSAKKHQTTTGVQQSSTASHTAGTAKSGKTTAKTGGGSGAPAASVPVNANQHEMIWPVENQKDVQVLMPFYDKNASQSDKLNAMIEYKKTFMPNTGVSLGSKDGKVFTVVAATAGTVTRVEDNPLLGKEVQVTGGNGEVTVYASLANVQVAKGDKVTQGEMLATAGRNELESSEGIHLHFEVLKDGQPLNPQNVLPKN